MVVKNPNDLIAKIIFQVVFHVKDSLIFLSHFLQKNSSLGHISGLDNLNVFIFVVDHSKLF